MFLDYLFLAFNTSTAFSPTDTASPGALGQGADDAAVCDIANHHRTAGGTCGQHPVRLIDARLESSVKIAARMLVFVLGTALLFAGTRRNEAIPARICRFDGVSAIRKPWAAGCR
jgi:hypothetical protein